VMLQNQQYVAKIAPKVGRVNRYLGQQAIQRRGKLQNEANSCCTCRQRLRRIAPVDVNLGLLPYTLR
jgi:hypothetical protein